MNDIPADWGTAVNVQAMVFGNMGDDSATGVGFTRDPATGENVFYGEYLINAQGEDVVAGIRTPKKIARARQGACRRPTSSCSTSARSSRSTTRTCRTSSSRSRTSKLYMLQTRNGKRTGFAAVRIAVEMVDEKLIPKEEALRRVEPEALNQLLHPVFLPSAKKAADRGGTPARQGPPRRSRAPRPARSCSSPTRRRRWPPRARPDLILVRHETSPEDIRGMNASLGHS